MVERDFEALGALFTEDAKLFNPGSPDVIVGRHGKSYKSLCILYINLVFNPGVVN